MFVIDKIELVLKFKITFKKFLCFQVRIKGEFWGREGGGSKLETESFKICITHTS
jgi:hypothetical protein